MSKPGSTRTRKPGRLAAALGLVLLGHVLRVSFCGGSAWAEPIWSSVLEQIEVNAGTQELRRIQAGTEGWQQTVEAQTAGATSRVAYSSTVMEHGVLLNSGIQSGGVHTDANGLLEVEYVLDLTDVDTLLYFDLSCDFMLATTGSSFGPISMFALALVQDSGSAPLSELAAVAWAGTTTSDVWRANGTLEPGSFYTLFLTAVGQGAIGGSPSLITWGDSNLQITSTFTWSAVPEPAGVSLLLLGAGVLVWRRRSEHHRHNRTTGGPPRLNHPNR